MSRMGEFVRELQETEDALEWHETQRNLNKEKTTDNQATSELIPETNETSF